MYEMVNGVFKWKDAKDQRISTLEAQHADDQATSKELRAARAATEQMREAAAKVCERKVRLDRNGYPTQTGYMAQSCAEDIRALPLPDGAKVLAERDAEIERLTQAQADFHMDYRMKCDEEGKQLRIELTTAHAVIEAAKKALERARKAFAKNCWRVEQNAAAEALAQLNALEKKKSMTKSDLLEWAEVCGAISNFSPTLPILSFTVEELITFANGIHLHENESIAED